MKTIEVPDIKKYLKGSRYIGQGTTAKCYRLPDNRIVKVYRDTPRKESLFKRNGDMSVYLNKLGSISNDTFIGPEEIIMCDDEVIGFIMQQAQGKTLNHMDRKNKLDVLLDQINDLNKDVEILSNRDYAIHDLHDQNMVYSPQAGFKLIDLDGGSINLPSMKEYNLRINNSLIKNILFRSIFSVPFGCDFTFDLKSDEDFYWNNPRIEDVLEYFKDYTDNSNPTIKEMSKSRNKFLSLHRKEIEL